LPRAVVPGRTYMITRRCSERRFFLRPDAATNNAFVYCLAVAADRYQVKVLFTSTMSNHHHTGIVDVLGNFPDFLAYFHKLFAKHQNALRGRWEAFWAPEQTSAVELVEPDDVFAKMVYALGNPVKDFIVEKVHHWPGVNSLAAILDGKPLLATRPKTFFRPDGDMPETARLSFHRPPNLGELTHAQFAARLRADIAKVESDAAATRAKSGRRVVGRHAVRHQHWNESPHTREPRRVLDPRVACRNQWRRKETLGRNRTWVNNYRTARELLLKGIKATFPHGTFLLRRLAGVDCEPVPPSTG